MSDGATASVDGDGPTVMLSADMDALPVQVPYSQSSCASVEQERGDEHEDQQADDHPYEASVQPGHLASTAWWAFACLPSLLP